MLNTPAISSRRSFVRSLSSGMASTFLCRWDTSALPVNAFASALSSPPSWLADLREAAKNKALCFGTSIKQEIAIADPSYVEAVLLASECLASEAEFHWQFMSPRRGVRDFRRSDWFVELALSHGIEFRGGNLIWHHRLPTWFPFLSPSAAHSEMVAQLTAVVSRFRTRVESWDVVNEALEPEHGAPGGFRRSLLFEKLGPGFVATAFEAAAAAHPAALLTYNDYGFEYETRRSLARRRALLALLADLKSQGVPVSALGIQSHLRGEERAFGEREFRSFLAEVASMGLKILVTELDVRDDRLGSSIQQRDQLVADAYERYL